MAHSDLINKTKDGSKYKITAESGTDYRGRRNRKCKTVIVKDIKELRREETAWQAEVDQYFLRTDNKRAKDSITIRDMMYGDVFTACCKNKSVNTIHGYEICRDRIVYILGDLAVKDIDNYTVQKMIYEMEAMDTIESQRRHNQNAKIETKKYAPKTIKSTYSVLALCLGLAAKWHIIDSDPCHDIDLPLQTSREICIFSESELGVFLDNLDTLDLDTRVMFELALFGSLRRGEALAITDDDHTWSHFLIDTARYDNHGSEELKDPKSSAGKRYCALPDFVIDDIHALQKYHSAEKDRLGSLWINSNYLLKMSDGSAMSPGRANERLQDYLARIGIKTHVTYHGLRHTYASMLIDNGISLGDLAARMGHADPRITLSTYAHLWQKQHPGPDPVATYFDSKYGRK